MSLGIPVTIPMSAARYDRPPLGWIIRRARRLQRAYGIDRKTAVFDARRDYMDFVGLHHKHLLRLIRGGAHG
ncbi:hypothetical protein SAMN05192589_107140 [Paracidovorax valerianellae]|uniref:Uncharacterized protein n=1 Tax=Paracidovorax valerianellae TaxID=187868 RepID=A0A1G6VUA1_9BURK|nr:hypothetical protein [Paracidovorax valerianellae]SDD57141.1 hypothetical protein SAMN05192589_107140 [Paracidovorax valerianellae]